MKFDHNEHQKVRLETNGILYVVSLKDTPNFYQLGDDDDVVIHIVNKWDDITYNEHPNMQKQFTRKKKDLYIQGGLVKE